jgi:hypothetical protein
MVSEEHQGRLNRANPHPAEAGFCNFGGAISARIRSYRAHHRLFSQMTTCGRKLAEVGGGVKVFSQLLRGRRRSNLPLQIVCGGAAIADLAGPKKAKGRSKPAFERES